MSDLNDRARLQIALSDRYLRIANDTRRTLNERHTARLMARRALYAAQTMTDEARDMAWRESSTAETVDLAKRRGEVVTQGPQHVRISSRDGLRTLYDANHITADQYREGLVYRSLYEGTQAGGLTANLEATPSGNAPGSTAHRGMVQIKRNARRLRIDTAVGRSLGPFGLKVLQQVAGEGVSASALCKGRGGSHWRRIVRELGFALDVATEVR